jgi:hypothetical protein
MGSGRRGLILEPYILDPKNKLLAPNPETQTPKTALETLNSEP